MSDDKTKGWTAWEEFGPTFMGNTIGACPKHGEGIFSEPNCNQDSFCQLCWDDGNVQRGIIHVDHEGAPIGKLTHFEPSPEREIHKVIELSKDRTYVPGSASGKLTLDYVGTEPPGDKT